jgi:hypothetical protein
VAKIVDLFTAALRETGGDDENMACMFAYNIEAELHKSLGGGSKPYSDKVRSLLFNLKKNQVTFIVSQMFCHRIILACAATLH